MSGFGKRCWRHLSVQQKLGEFLSTIPDLVIHNLVLTIGFVHGPNHNVLTIDAEIAYLLPKR